MVKTSKKKTKTRSGISPKLPIIAVIRKTILSPIVLSQKTSGSPDDFHLNDC